MGPPTRTIPIRNYGCPSAALMVLRRALTAAAQAYFGLYQMPCTASFMKSDLFLGAICPVRPSDDCWTTR
jgi:hypothetical protein